MGESLLGEMVEGGGFYVGKFKNIICSKLEYPFRSKLLNTRQEI